MEVAEPPARLNVLVVTDGSNQTEAMYTGLDQLGWRPLNLTVDGLNRSHVVSRPPDAALLAITESVTGVMNAMQSLLTESPGVPIIVLTDDIEAAEQALIGGAAAVLPSRSRTSLLHAQLCAVLRQTAPLAQASELAGILRARALRVDTLRHAIAANNRELDLTPTEYRILSMLVRHAGRALSADFLLQQSSGADFGREGARHIVKVHVARLRKKLADATGEPDYIANIRGVGYLLERRRRGTGRR